MVHMMALLAVSHLHKVEEVRRCRREAPAKRINTKRHISIIESEPFAAIT